MFRARALACIAAMGLAGCASHPAIPVSEGQSLVMESSVLASGITAGQPAVSLADDGARAKAGLYNEQSKPVTLHYRFYWYDGDGLEVHPLEAVRTVVVPAQSGVTLTSSSRFTYARKVRLYLYL